LDVSPTFFEILTFKARKWLVFSPLPSLTPPLGENALEFLDETYASKTKGMGLPLSENFTILTSSVFWPSHPCDEQTDEQRDGR